METLRYRPTREDHEKQEKFRAYLQQCENENDDIHQCDNEMRDEIRHSHLSPPSTLSTATTLCGTPMSTLSELSSSSPPSQQHYPQQQSRENINVQLPLYTHHSGTVPKLCNVNMYQKRDASVLQWSRCALDPVSAHTLSRRILHERQWLRDTTHTCNACSTRSNCVIRDAQMRVYCDTCVEKYAMCLMCARTHSETGNSLTPQRYRLTHNAICDACSYRSMREQYHIARDIALLCNYEHTAT